MTTELLEQAIKALENITQRLAIAHLKATAKAEASGTSPPPSFNEELKPQNDALTALYAERRRRRELCDSSNHFAIDPDYELDDTDLKTLEEAVALMQRDFLEVPERERSFAELLLDICRSNWRLQQRYMKGAL